jgi:mRNA degradation ribonuclease J1/J2
MLVRSPELHALGVVDGDGLSLQRARESVRDELAQLSDYGRRDPGQLREAAVRGVQRSFRRDGERRPAVQALMVEL